MKKPELSGAEARVNASADIPPRSSDSLPKGADNKAQVPIWLVILVGLALARGLVYANLLHPWGLIDEEQHLDYVGVLVETGARPLANRDLLAPELAQRVFDSQRWPILFRSPGPAGPDPDLWGLEGYSYQGYHPPLYYVVLTPFYLFTPDDPLLKLFYLRWVTVGLSVISVVLVGCLLRELWPDRPALVVLTTLIYVWLPERTIAVSRLNNDVLLELASASALWASLRIGREGWRTSLAAWLGLSIGLGVLAKLPALLLMVLPVGLFMQAWRTGRAWRGLVLVVVLVAIWLTPLVWSNLRDYQDPTGFAGFNQLAGFMPRAITVEAVAWAMWGLWANAWVIWWWGADVSTGPSVLAFYAIWAMFCLVALAGLARRARAAGIDRGPWPVWLALLVVNGAAVVVSYFAGQVPVVQGRLLLPSLLVAVVALSAGWWQWVEERALWVRALPLLALILIDGAYLRYLLYSFYQVPAETLTGSANNVLGAFLSDKPDGWLWVAGVSLALYGLSLAGTAWWVTGSARVRPAP